MDQTINTGAMAQGFAALAQALAPNYQGMIEADLARYKRDNMQADTGYRNALTGKTSAETAGITADNAAEAAMRSALASGLVDPKALGAIFAGAGTDAQAMTAMPGFVTGYRTTLDPNFVNDPTFSGVLAGTGVQAYQNTPGGVADALANGLTVQGMKDKTSLAIQGLANTGAAIIERLRGQSSQAVQGIADAGALARQQAANQGAVDLQNDQQDFTVQYPQLAVPGKGRGATDLGLSDPLDAMRVLELAKATLGGDKAPPQIAAQVAADAMELVRRGLAPDISSAIQALAKGYTPATDGILPLDATAATYANPFAGVLTGLPPNAAGGTPAGAAPAAAPAGGTGGGTVQVGGQTYTEGQVISLRDGREFTVRGGQLVQTK